MTDYDIAQKYGALKEYNHTAGIIYTPNPFILVVMTEYCPAPDGVIGGYAKLMTEYTLKLDEKLDEYNKQLEEQKKAEEEAKRQEELKKQQEEETRKAAEEKAKLEAQATPVPTAVPEVEAEKEEKSFKGPMLVAAAAIMAALIVFVFARAGRKRRVKNTYTPRH